MASHYDPTRSCVLQVTITQLIYPVTEKVLGQLFDAYGVNDVCMLQHSTHLEAFVEFQSWHEASKAQGALHGRYIYDGCCLLDIQHAPLSISVMRLPNSELVVVDWDQVEVAPLASFLTPSTSTPATLFTVITSAAICEVSPEVCPAVIGPIIDKAIDCEVLVALPAPHNASAPATTYVEEAQEDVFPVSVGPVSMVPTTGLTEYVNQARQHSNNRGFVLFCVAGQVICRSQGGVLVPSESQNPSDPTQGLLVCEPIREFTPENLMLVKLQIVQWDPGILEFPFLGITFGNHPVRWKNGVSVDIEQQAEHETLLHLFASAQLQHIAQVGVPRIQQFEQYEALLRACSRYSIAASSFHIWNFSACALLFSTSSAWCFTRWVVHSVSVTLPGSYMNTHSQGEDIWTKVNSLTSIQTEMHFRYYSLPYCCSPGNIKKSVGNLGELLMGDQIDNSPYRFLVHVNECLFLCTPKELNENDAKLLQRSNDLYQVNMMLDNLSIMRFIEQNGVTVHGTGCAIDYTPASSADDSSINSLKFEVLVHDYKGANVKIISTGEEGSAVISEMYKLGRTTDIFILKLGPNYPLVLHVMQLATRNWHPGYAFLLVSSLIKRTVWTLFFWQWMVCVLLLRPWDPGISRQCTHGGPWFRCMLLRCGARDEWPSLCRENQQMMMRDGMLEVCTAATWGQAAFQGAESVTPYISPGPRLSYGPCTWTQPGKWSLAAGRIKLHARGNTRKEQN